jgi:thiol-disulfide isomerase/thioredoxin
MNIKTSILILLLFVLGLAQAQITTIEGKVLDKQTQEGIPYVNMGLPHLGIGTSANENGEFVLKIAAEKLSETLVFSCMGYGSFKIKASNLVKQTKIVVFLEPVNIKLDEFTFKSFEGKKLLKEVLKKRTANYATEPSIIQAFCREVIRESNSNRYFVESEGVLETYKPSVKKNADQVRLVRGRKKNLPNYFVHDSIQYPLPKITNAPTIGVLLDIIKAPEYFIVSNNSYKFIHEGYESINDRLAYKIQFSAESPEQTVYKMGEMPLFEGTFYVDTASFALVRADFITNRLGVASVNRSFHPIHMPLKLLSRSYTVNYSLKNEKWFFHSAIVDNKYVYYPNLMNLSSKIEYFTTNVLTDSVKRFAKSETISQEEMLVDKISDFDDSFWGEYNFVKSSKVTDSMNITPSVSLPVEPKPERQSSVDVGKKISKNTASKYAFLPTNSVQFSKMGLEEAFKLAAEQGKNVFIDAYANWCMPCKKMDAEAFHNKHIADKMNAFFINLKVDVDNSGRNIALKYGIKALPTVLILNPQGVVLEQFQGYAGVNHFDNQINTFIKRTNNGSLYLSLSEKFEKGKWDFTLLEYYAQLRRSLGLSTDNITDAMVSKLPVDTLKLMQYHQFLFSYAQSLESKTVDYFLKNTQEKMFQYKLKALIQQNLHIAVQLKDKNLLKQILKANTRFKLTADGDGEKVSTQAACEEENTELSAIFYKKTEDYKHYHEVTTELIERFYLPNLSILKQQGKAADLKKYGEKLRSIAHFYTQNLKEKKYLEVMVPLLQKATDFYTEDTALVKDLTIMSQ